MTAYRAALARAWAAAEAGADDVNARAAEAWRAWRERAAAPRVARAEGARS